MSCRANPFSAVCSSQNHREVIEELFEKLALDDMKTAQNTGRIYGLPNLYGLRYQDYG